MLSARDERDDNSRDEIAAYPLHARTYYVDFIRVRGIDSKSTTTTAVVSTIGRRVVDFDRTRDERVDARVPRRGRDPRCRSTVFSLARRKRNIKKKDHSSRPKPLVLPATIPILALLAPLPVSQIFLRAAASGANIARDTNCDSFSRRSFC